MGYTVFIHTNEKQYLGALVAAHALQRNSRHAGEFDVQILNTRDFPFLQHQEGGVYLNAGVKRTWPMFAQMTWVTRLSSRKPIGL